MATHTPAERMRLSPDEAAGVARDRAGFDVEDLTIGERAAVVLAAELEGTRAARDSWRDEALAHRAELVKLRAELELANQVMREQGGELSDAEKDDYMTWCAGQDCARLS